MVWRVDNGKGRPPELDIDSQSDDLSVACGLDHGGQISSVGHTGSARRMSGSGISGTNSVSEKAGPPWLGGGGSVS